MGCGKSKATDVKPGAVAKAASPPKGSEASNTAPRKKLRTDAHVRDVYKIGKTLGSGGFAVVKLGVDKVTGEEFAIKIMVLPEEGATIGDNENSRDDVFKEIAILVDLDHPNVIHLKEYFQEQGRVYLVTELLTGGELLDAVLERGSYSEAIARDCFVQLLKGIAYLHSIGVVHRDLKLENLLLAEPNNLSRIKIADFGLAKQGRDSHMRTICGTPQYVAPEVIQGTPGQMYGPAVDLWSAGVVLFILLGGYPPFFDENEPALFAKIRAGKFSFDDPVWDAISDEAKDVVKQLLRVDPAKRLTAAEALQHPWCTAALSEATPELPRTLDNLRRISRSRFRGAVQTVIALQRLSHISKRVQAGEAAHGELLSDPKDLEDATAAAIRLDARISSDAEFSVGRLSSNSFRSRSSRGRRLSLDSQMEHRASLGLEPEGPSPEMMGTIPEGRLPPGVARSRTSESGSDAPMPLARAADASTPLARESAPPLRVSMAA